MIDWCEEASRIDAYGFNGSQTFFAGADDANLEIGRQTLANWERELLGFTYPLVSENID